MSKVIAIWGAPNSGKTTFATGTLTDERFTEDCRTLLLLCEEGMEEYPMDELTANNVVVEVIEDEDDINVFDIYAILDSLKAHK